MNTDFVSALLINVSLLLSISIIYNLLFYSFRRRNILFSILLGLVVGLLGIYLIMNAVVAESDIIFDTRSILVSVSGLFFGFIPTVIAVAAICVYRIILGGSGQIAGVLVTVLTAGLGLLWRHFRFNKLFAPKIYIWLEFYLFSLITHVIMLACMFTLPRERIFAILGKITLPVLAIYPAASTILCMVMFFVIKNIQTEIHLADSELRFRTMFEQAPIGIAISNNDDIPYYNAMFEQITKRKKEEIIALGWESYTHPDDLKEEENKLVLLRSGNIPSFSMVKRYFKPDGEIIWVNMTVSALRIGSEPNRNYLCMIQDITQVHKAETERKTREDEILYLSYHDILTGLYNRTYFEKEIRRYDAAEYLPLSVIVGDINGLKFVNDAFGHAQGDALLVEMSQIIVSCCRKEDIVVRTGGDEFNILPPRTDSAASEAIVDQIKKACAEYGSQADKKLYGANISLGYATKTKEDEPFHNIFKVAEEFMYRQKLLEHKSLHSAILSSIKTAMFEKSNETEEHAERMTELSASLGKAFGLSENDLVSLELVSTLHDIGKISIDQRILAKPGKLTKEEWAEIRKHPAVGYRIALTVPELSRIAEFILCHHERWDGSGYPQGLKGQEIPVISRILTIVDSYDAMTQDRAYRKAMSKEEAVAEIRENAGTQFDPVLSEIFIEKVLPYEGASLTQKAAAPRLETEELQPEYILHS